MVDELFERLPFRYTEFMMLLNEFLPEYSELNPVHPPRMHWRRHTALFELLRRDDAQIPVTRAFFEEHRNVILDIVTEYNCNLRADLIQIASEDPMGPAKPIAMSEEKALEALNSASTLFVNLDQDYGLRGNTLYTYNSLVEDIRKEHRFDELDVRLQFGGYSSYSWPTMLLEKLGLDGDATWDAVEERQAKMPLVCLCGKPSFKQPGSCIQLVSYCRTPVSETVANFRPHDSFRTFWKSRIGTWISRWFAVAFRANPSDLFRSCSLHPTQPRFDYDHNTIDLSKLRKIIVKWDPENDPSLDTLLEKHRQKLIKGAKEVKPHYILAPPQGHGCPECRPAEAVMSWEMLQWHSLTK